MAPSGDGADCKQTTGAPRVKGALGGAPWWWRVRRAPWSVRTNWLRKLLSLVSGSPSSGNPDWGYGLREGLASTSTYQVSSLHRTVRRCLFPSLLFRLLKRSCTISDSYGGNYETITHSHGRPCRKYVLKVFLWFHLCYRSDHDFIHFYCWVAFPHMNTSQLIPLWKGIWAVSSFGRLHIKLRWTLLQKAFPGFTVSLLQDKIIRSGITGLQGRYTFNFFRETTKFSTVAAFHARMSVLVAL